MEDNWEARVIFSPGRVANNVFLSRHRRGEGGVREFVVEGGAKYVTVVPDKPIKDEELVFATLDEDQLRALQVAISAHGIKLPDAGFNNGKLEAMNLHLEDMRHLVFKDEQ
jgi:hypothetical protein